MKRIAWLVLFTVILAGCAYQLNLPDEPPYPGNRNTGVLVGAAIDYAGLGFSPALFSTDVVELTFAPGETTKSIQLSANDDAIYRYGYTSLDSAAWQQFEIPTGTILGSNWYTGALGHTLTFNKNDLVNGTDNYIVLYSCTREGLLWDCHGEQWQIVQFEVTILGETSTSDPKQDLWDELTVLSDFYYEAWDTYQEDNSFSTPSTNDTSVGSWKVKGTNIPANANLYWIGNDIIQGYQWIAPTGAGYTRPRYYDWGNWDRFVNIHNGNPQQYQSNPGQIGLSTSHDIIYLFRSWHGADRENVFDRVKVWPDDLYYYAITGEEQNSASGTRPVRGEEHVLRIQRNATTKRHKIWLNENLLIDFVATQDFDLNELIIGTNAHPHGHHARAILAKDGSFFTASEWNQILTNTDTLWPRNEYPEYPYLDQIHNLRGAQFDEATNVWNAQQLVDQSTFSGGSGTAGTHTIQWYYARDDLGWWLDYHYEIPGENTFQLDRDDHAGPGGIFENREGDGTVRLFYVVTPYDDQGRAGVPIMSNMITDNIAGTPQVTPTCSDGVQNGDETGVDCGGSCGACSGGEVSTENYCSSATVSACHSQFNRLEVIVDGDENTYDTTFNSCTDPEWWQFDLGQTRILSNVYFKEKNFFDGWIATSPLYYVEYWDGNAWQQTNIISRDPANVDGSHTGGNWHNVTFDPVQTTSFRLRFYAAGDKTFTGLNEVECYGLVPAYCTDSVQNGDETDVDCGGSCAACPSCSDGILNQDETAVDCGGVCPICTTDNDNDGVVEGTDCNDNDNTIYQNLNGYVDADSDGYTLGSQQLVCSGASLPSGYSVTSIGDDCNDANVQVNPGQSEICWDGLDNNCDSQVDEGCVATCSDGVQNGGETGVDCGGSCGACSVGNTTGVGETQTFAANELGTHTLPFALYLPPNYNDDTNKDFPLLLFLHGAGEKGPSDGSELYKTWKWGPLKYVDESWWTYEFIIVAPQLPGSSNSWWYGHPEAVVNIVKDQWRVDETRMYITGLSLGGIGTFKYIKNKPDTFAAAAPIAGWPDNAADACIWKNKIPIWIFHGDGDSTVNPTRAVDTYYNLEYACDPPNPDPLSWMTLYDSSIVGGWAHNSWTPTYNPTQASYALNAEPPYSDKMYENTPYGTDTISVYDWFLQFTN